MATAALRVRVACGAGISRCPPARRRLRRSWRAESRIVVEHEDRTVLGSQPGEHVIDEVSVVDRVHRVWRPVRRPAAS